MTEIEKQIEAILRPTIEQKGFYIDHLSYGKKGKDFILELFVEKGDFEAIDLDEIVHLSEELSPLLDEADLLKENYLFDVSTSGAEKPIKDFTKFPALIGRYVEIRVQNAIQGENVFFGTIESASAEQLVITYKEKTRVKKVEIPLTNITKANLAVHI